jgi:hypothetical protein
MCGESGSAPPSFLYRYSDPRRLPSKPATSCGESIKQALLRFDGDDRPPIGHPSSQIHGMDTDIGATIDRDHAISEMLSASLKQLEQKFDVVTGIRPGLKHIITYTVFMAVRGAAIIKTIKDEGPVIGRSQHEGESPFGHTPSEVALFRRREHTTDTRVLRIATLDKRLEFRAFDDAW